MASPRNRTGTAPVPGPPTDGIAPPDMGGAPLRRRCVQHQQFWPESIGRHCPLDPQTGQYATADGHVGRQTDLADPAKTGRLDLQDRPVMLARALACVATGGDRGMCVTPVAHAADEVAINGSYTAFSDGQWAQTNQSYHDEPSVTQTWTISSTCTTFQDCTGTGRATRAE
jgi:hypothetical protein